MNELTLDASGSNPTYPQRAETFESYEFDGLGRPLTSDNDYCHLVTSFDSLGRPLSDQIAFLNSNQSFPGDHIQDF